jgi:hypothetical protein
MEETPKGDFIARNEHRSGFWVTSPLRTLIDATIGGISQEELRKAVGDALPRGLVRRAKIVQVDLVLLLEREIPDAGRIRAALSATFSTRSTHSLPKTLASPPDSWAVDFRGMAEEANISTADVLLAFAVPERFWAENGFGQERT